MVVKKRRQKRKKTCVERRYKGRYRRTRNRITLIIKNQASIDSPSWVLPLDRTKLSRSNDAAMHASWNPLEQPGVRERDKGLASFRTRESWHAAREILLVEKRGSGGKIRDKARLSVIQGKTRRLRPRRCAIVDAVSCPLEIHPFLKRSNSMIGISGNNYGMRC